MRRKVSTVVDDATFHLLEYLSLAYDTTISYIIRESIAYHLAEILKHTNRNEVNNIIEYVVNRMKLEKKEAKFVSEILKIVFKDPEKTKNYIMKSPLKDELITGVIIKEIKGEENNE